MILVKAYNSKFTAILILATLLMTISANLSAKDRADKLPIEVSADTFQLTESTSEAIYEGNVIFTQGPIKIEADKLKLKRLLEEDLVFTYGLPATFTQKATTQEEDIEAEAQRFEYSSKNKKLKLYDNAILKQKGATFTGDYIYYDTITESVGAEGTENSKVIMVLPPKK